jgi:hypothetical protein
MNQVVANLGEFTDVKIVSGKIRKFDNGVLLASQNLDGGVFTAKSCLVRIVGHSPEYGTIVAGTYTVDIKCSAPITSRDIYPKGENYDPDTVFDEPY